MNAALIMARRIRVAGCAVHFRSSSFAVGDMGRFDVSVTLPASNSRVTRAAQIGNLHKYRPTISVFQVMIAVAAQALAVCGSAGRKPLPHFVRLMAIDAGGNGGLVLPQPGANDFAVDRLQAGMAFAAACHYVCISNRRARITGRKNIVCSVAGDTVGAQDQPGLLQPGTVNAVNVAVVDVGLGEFTFAFF